jgi:hypothetical protein
MPGKSDALTLPAPTDPQRIMLTQSLAAEVVVSNY